MSKKNYDSILRMARGAIEERVDYEMDRVMQMDGAEQEPPRTLKLSGAVS